MLKDAVGTTRVDEKFIFSGKFGTSELGRSKLEYLLWVDAVKTPVQQETEKVKASKLQRDRIKAMKDIIKEVSAKYPGKEGAPVEEVYVEAESKHGIDRAHAEEYIKRMKQGGDLHFPDQKHIRLVA